MWQGIKGIKLRKCNSCVMKNRRAIQGQTMYMGIEFPHVLSLLLWLMTQIITRRIRKWKETQAIWLGIFLQYHNICQLMNWVWGNDGQCIFHIAGLGTISALVVEYVMVFLLTAVYISISFSLMFSFI